MKKIYTKSRRWTIKQKAIDYLGGKCSACGYDRCISALEFDHKDPSTKSFGISKALSCHGTSSKWENIRPELDKCVLLCSNCHKERHFTGLLKGVFVHEKSPEKQDWPILIDLISTIQSTSFEVTGRTLGVSGNAVRKHLKKFGIDPKSIRSIKDNGARSK